MENLMKKKTRSNFRSLHSFNLEKEHIADTINLR